MLHLKIHPEIRGGAEHFGKPKSRVRGDGLRLAHHTFDAGAIPLYLVKGLPFTAGLYLTFLALCVLGLREWMRAEPRGEPRS